MIAKSICSSDHWALSARRVLTVLPLRGPVNALMPAQMHRIRCMAPGMKEGWKAAKHVSRRPSFARHCETCVTDIPTILIQEGETIIGCALVNKMCVQVAPAVGLLCSFLQTSANVDAPSGLMGRACSGASRAFSERRAGAWVHLLVCLGCLVDTSLWLFLWLGDSNCRRRLRLCLLFEFFVIMGRCADHLHTVAEHHSS